MENITDNRVEKAEEANRRALKLRASVIRCRDAGMTIAATADQLQVTQSTVRHILSETA